MAESEEMRERLRRATAYPYEIPAHSFVQRGTRTVELTDLPDLGDREPLLAYGSNVAPEALARKLAADPDTPLPLIRAELSDYDVVYSDHLSPYGAVPATLYESPGTTVSVFVAYPTDAQRRLLSATEPNYEPQHLGAVSCRLDNGTELDRLDAFRSRHGALRLDRTPVALTAIRAAGRSLPEQSEPEVLERVRSAFFPELSLEQTITKVSGSDGLPLSFP